ncbi:MAG: DUF3090 family protein [SAR202 cluster bacterium]|nr:DUF3090 family protein [SAR202 cluster bacterium]|tara:strand:+ start:25 stop:528 length:504 start_codon:yes stop_codon:yes gene_type:complete
MKYDIGTPQALNIDAFGFPGERTFRIFLECSGSSISLWLEKQQLFELAMAISRILEVVKDNQTVDISLEENLEPIDKIPVEVEFTVGRLSLAHNPASNLFIIEAYNISDNVDDEANITFHISKSKLQDISTEAFKICASGRPICSLCGEPMDLELHICSEPDGIIQI